MGFRTGAFAKVWSVEPRSDTSLKMRISISKKNRQSGEYEQEFSGFVMVIGSAAVAKAMKLKENARIKLGDVDVTTTYNKELKKEYVNYKVFSFELDDGSAPAKKASTKKTVDDGEPYDNDSSLPY